MRRFGPDPLSFFQAVYQQQAPWDIGAPQPAMAALFEQHPPSGPALDLGCGSGDLSIYLAQLGCPALGIDFVETAIRQAHAKRDALPPQVAARLDFQVADAARPSLLGRKFGAVVDSGFYHLFDPEECDHLVDEVASILRPKGCYYLHEFSIEFPAPNLPRRITAEEIQARFTVERGWRIKELQTVEFLSNVAPPVPAICACIERLDFPS